MPRSVRARTTMLATTVVTGALVVASIALVAGVTRSLSGSSDDVARSRAAELAAQLAAGTLPRVVPGIGDDSLAQVVAADGRVLAASANLAGQPAVSGVRPRGAAAEVRTMRDLPDDSESEDYRVWMLRARTPDGMDAVVYVGPSLESAQEAGTRLVAGLLLGVPVLVALLAGALWLLVGRALRPMDRIRARVATLGAADLDQRVPVPDTGDEVARLAETMNAMLARLEESDTRQREFVANASHDLQSPLTALRAELEVALADPAVDWPRVAREALAESTRMESLVQDLLFLARVDAAQPQRPSRLVDLDDVVREEVDRARVTSRVPITSRLDAAPVRGHGDDLARLVRNLLDNATRHADSTVTVHLDSDDETAVLRVADDGPGVPEAERERVFERFVRLDPSRRRTDAGTGLGLAIVRSVAESHGGSVRLVAAATVEVRLPVAARPVSSRPSGRC